MRPVWTQAPRDLTIKSVGAFIDAYMAISNGRSFWPTRAPIMDLSPPDLAAVIALDDPGRLYPVTRICRWVANYRCETTSLG
jgi:hypothetical protein